MNSFFFNHEVGNDKYLKFNKEEEKVIYPELRGSDTGRFSQKSERLCQSIPTNQQLLFVPTKISKRRKRKTVIYELEDTNTYSQNLFCSSQWSLKENGNKM